MKKLYLFTFVPLVVALFALCLAVRMSYTNVGNEVLNYKLMAGITEESIDYSNQASLLMDCGSFDEMSDKADLVIKCKVKEGRDIVECGLFTPVTVEEVYKGDKSLKNKDITVIERARFYIDKHEEWSGLFSGPLEENQEYVIMLFQRKYDKNKVPDEYEKNQFFIVGNMPFAIFRPTDTKQTKLFTYLKQYPLTDLKGMDIMACDQATLDAYYKQKDKIFKEFNIAC